MANTDHTALKAFLQQLDDADNVTVTDWEAKFIESGLSHEFYSAKQREIILRLMEKYGQRIGFL